MNRRDDFSSSEDEARAWLIYLYSNEVSPSKRIEFEEWLKRSPQNANAYRDLEQAWRDLALVAEPSLAAHLPLPTAHPHGNRLSRRVLLVGGAGVAAAAVVAPAIFVLRGQYGDVPEEAVYGTKPGEIVSISLSDGSEAVLDTNTTLRSSFSSRERRVELLHGRAHFDVKKPSNRAFIIEAGMVEVRVIGTQFEVGVTQEQVTVGVDTGEVQAFARRLQAKRGRDAMVRVVAGERVVFESQNQRWLRTTFDQEQSRNWRSGRLSYVGERLGTVVADVNRYRSTPIVVSDKALEGLQVTMAFRVDQMEVFLDALSATQPIEIKREGDQVFLLQREPFLNDQ